MLGICKNIYFQAQASLKKTTLKFTFGELNYHHLYTFHRVHNPHMCQKVMTRKKIKQIIENSKFMSIHRAGYFCATFFICFFIFLIFLEIHQTDEQLCIDKHKLWKIGSRELERFKMRR